MGPDGFGMCVTPSPGDRYAGAASTILNCTEREPFHQFDDRFPAM